MSLIPILNAGFVTQLHIVAAVMAIVLGSVVLWRQKGTPTHKTMGRIWVGLMVIVAVSSFFIHELKTWGRFSPIHLVSIGTLISLVWSITAIRRGNIRAHKSGMLGVFVGGLGIAGTLSFLPGRLLHRAIFADLDIASIGQTGAIWITIIGAFASACAVALLARSKSGM
ncbi:MAG: DUF2306 domain-containing protein [Pseudomonadota bacterium]